MFIFSNLAISLDGKIATSDRSFFPLGTPEDRREMQRLRLRADAILNGASTLRTFRRPFRITAEFMKKSPAARSQPANIVISHSLQGISPEWPFFKDASIRRILFVSAGAPESRLKRFRASCEIVPMKTAADGGITASAIVKELSRLGFRNVLVEGGGGIMWDFARENLVDEYHVTLTPWILGGTNAPTLVDGKGFNPENALKVRLKSCRKVGQELYLVYARTSARHPRRTRAGKRA